MNFFEPTSLPTCGTVVITHIDIFFWYRYPIQKKKKNYYRRLDAHQSMNNYITLNTIMNIVTLN